MNKGKILSIIVPMYNMEQYIDQCLSSLIIGEGMEDLEVLVINDGSRDSSLSLARKYEQQYPQTYRVIDKENGNYGSCINRGLAECTGRYVRVLDADDYLETSNLAEFVRLLSCTELDMVFSDYNKVDGNGRFSRLVRNRRLHPDKTYSTRDLTRHRLYVFIHNVTYRTELLKAMHYHQSEGLSYTDQEWIFLPMAMVKSWKYWPNVNYNYRLGREGQTVSKEAHIRTMSHEIKGFLGNVRTYEQIKGTLSKDACSYLRHRLQLRAKVIYEAFLLYYHHEMASRMGELEHLDKELQHLSPETYELAAKLHFHIGPFRYYFVQRWRKSGYNTTLWGLRHRRQKKA